MFSWTNDQWKLSDCCKWYSKLTPRCPNFRNTKPIGLIVTYFGESDTWCCRSCHCKVLPVCHHLLLPKVWLASQILETSCCPIEDFSPQVAAADTSLSPSTFSETSTIKIYLGHLQIFNTGGREYYEASKKIISAARFWWRRRQLIFFEVKKPRSLPRSCSTCPTSCWASVYNLVVVCGLQCACVMIIGDTLLGLMLLYVCLLCFTLFCCWHCSLALDMFAVHADWLSCASLWSHPII